MVTAGTWTSGAGRRPGDRGSPGGLGVEIGAGGRVQRFRRRGGGRRRVGGLGVVIAASPRSAGPPSPMRCTPRQSIPSARPGSRRASAPVWSRSRPTCAGSSATSRTDGAAAGAPEVGAVVVPDVLVAYLPRRAGESLHQASAACPLAAICSAPGRGAGRGPGCRRRQVAVAAGGLQFGLHRVRGRRVCRSCRAAAVVPDEGQRDSRPRPASGQDAAAAAVVGVGEARVGAAGIAVGHANILPLPLRRWRNRW